MGTKNNLPQDKAINSLWLLLPDAIKYCFPRITIIIVAALFCFFAQGSWANGEIDPIKATQKKKTVWYRYIEHGLPLGNDSRFYNKKTGDIYIVYLSEKNKPPVQSSRADFNMISFFRPEKGIKQHVNIDNYVDKYGYRYGPVQLNNGNSAFVQNFDSHRPTRCPQELNFYLTLIKPDTNDIIRNIKIKDKWRNENFGLGFFKPSNINGEVLKRVSFIYKLKKPIKTKTGNTCATGPDASYTISYVTLGSGSLIVPSDENYFIFGGPNLVLRLNNDLSFPKICEIKNLVMVDTEKIRQLYDFEDKSYQQLQDDFKKVFEEERSQQCP